ncbi:MAG: hypothetical protein IJZ95_01625 [Oscillospiraceae bacterium]|nr:hypothetical protein [Oscillospiraceae bacterium]
MDNKKKIDFKKHVLPVILLVALIIGGIFFKDELGLLLGTSESSGSGSGDTYYSDTVSDSSSSKQDDISSENDEISSLPESTPQSSATSTSSTTEQSSSTESVPETSAPTESKVEIEYYFRSESKYTQHYEKHGDEFTPIFGKITLEEYLEHANALIASEDEDILTKYSDDGDFMYFRESTGEFLVLADDGYIRTYFIPDDGIEYWNRQ